MSRRKIAVVTAMWVLGAAAIAALGWLVQWLDGQPVVVPDAAEVPAAVPGDQPLASLTAGVARSAGAARVHLAAEERGQASHAIDAALRAAEVGHEASHGEVKAAFAVALREIHFTRQSLHLGDERAAYRDLGDVVAALAPVVDRARGLSPGVPPPEVWDGYHGAVLVNANGAMIGQVQQLRRTDDGVVARLRLGGANDVLIIMDFGGRSVEVPADLLLWGPRRSIGSVFVALPTESAATERILAELPGT